ncbi:integrase core domain-containing protein [Algoriphagus halophilus]|uniref:integrase core domain-containing protein n=1 Tax=Algoriphagus halophilus TaxID=226505 RepID=UPI00358E1644
MIRVDNGPEFISRLLDHWCREKNIELVFIQPGKPMQNGYVERCNGSSEKNCLAPMYLILWMRSGKAMEWMEDYNRERPHEALGYRTPVDLLKELK